MEKQKLLKNLKCRGNLLALLLTLVASIAFSSQAMAIDIYGNYYFDNTTVGWSNVYMIIGKSGWYQALPMNQQYAGVYKTIGGWNDAEWYFFADSNCGYAEGAGSSTAGSKKGNCTSNITTAYNNKMCVPANATGTSISSSWVDPTCPKEVLQGTKIMFYIGEETGWGQYNFQLTAGSKGSVVAFGRSVVESSSKRYANVCAPATCPDSKTYYVRHDNNDYEGHSIASGHPKAGMGYYNNDSGITSTGNGYTATITLGSSSIEPGGNVSFTSTKSTGNFGTTTSLKVYATLDNENFTELTVNGSTLTTSSLETGTWTIIPVCYDGWVYVKGTTTTLTVAAAGDAPTVLIADAPDVSGSIGTLFGYLKFTGCQNVTDYGFIWSTTQSDIEGTTPSGGTIAKSTDPTRELIPETDAGTSFKAEDVEFDAQNTIYYRAYATNAKGTSYSEEIRSFSTSGCIKPVVTGMTTVPDQICSNAGTIEATATAIDGVTYAWSVDGTVFTAASGTTNTATITVGATGTGSITVIPTRTSDACQGNPFTLSDKTVKDATITAKNLKVDDESTTEGETINFCEGQEITFKITSDYDVTTYSWSFPTGWTITSGEGTKEVVVTASATSGTVSATIANDCGNSATRNIVANVTAKPATPGAITGATNVCKGTPQTYSVAAVDGATGYEWILPTGWTGTCDPEGGNTITATPGAEAESGTIKVKATNDCGSSEYNTGIEVTVGGYSIAISGVGAKSPAATYPWEYMTLTATTDAENITWNCVYSGTVEADLTVFETNGKTAKLKSGADASETEHYTVTASSTDGGCQTTSPGYDVYINAADIEICD